MEYCIKVKPDTKMREITDILTDSLKEGFGMRYIGNVSGHNYHSIISDELDIEVTRRIKKVKGVEKIFSEIRTIRMD